MTRFSKGSLFVCLLAAASLLHAQFDTAEVLGTVRDASGAAVAKASVMLTNQDTGIQAKATTDENGNYDFFNVKAGRYTVSIEHPGFSKFSAPDILVNVNARQRVDAALAVGEVTQSVEVTGAASALETDTSEHGQVINTQAVTNLPLNGRSYADLALLATNVHRSPLASAPSTPREGAFNVNGMRSTYNNFLMDGVDNNAYSTSNQGFSNQVALPSPDGVAEFKVITSNFSAEYGRVGGAVVNVVMRSGSNDFHGGVFEFFRNTDLNAVGFFKPLGGVKPPLQRNQFGGDIGGPFVKNRIFFFADYEGYRNIQKGLNYDKLPNASDRTGILPVPVVNPLNGTVYAAGTPIPMTAFARKVLTDLPATNSGSSARGNDYQQLILAPRDYADKYDVKIDGQINDRMSGFVRFSQRKDNQFYQPTIAGPSGGDGNGYVRVLQQAAALGYTWTVSPVSLVEFRLGFTHILGGKQPPFIGGASMQDLYGVSGLPTFPQLTGGLSTQNIGGFTGMGRQATNPQFQNPTAWDPKLNYSWVKGRHALKMGAEMQIIHTEVMDINPVYGLMSYSGQFSKPTCAQLGQPTGCAISTDTSSYNLADFMFGVPSQVQLANWLVGNYRQRVYSLYLQDDFRVSSKLTLNLGVRWEFATPRWDRDNVLSNFDPATNAMLRAKDGGLYDRTLVDPDYRDWAPRLGAAYSIDRKTVFRAGYGISYVHLNRLGSADELGINGPQVVIGTLNQTATTPNLVTPQTGFPASVDSPATFNPVNANVAYIPRNTRWPYVQTWLASIQREISK